MSDSSTHSAAGQAGAALFSPPVTSRKGMAGRASSVLLDSLFILPFGCAVALLWANTLPESYYIFAHALAFPVNEIGIVLFFALMTKQVVEATLPGGVLHTWRRAALPVAAACGGVVGSIGVYLLFLYFLGEPMLRQTWVVPCAIDIAVCYLVAGVIFGRHPALPFLLLLAIFSDAIGLALIATLHPADPGHLALGAALMVAALASAVGLRRRRFTTFWPYLLVCGTLSWLGLYIGGVHPALALVPVVPFLPHATRDAGLFVEPTPQAQDALTRFERWCKWPVHAVLFMFGVVNAGVPLFSLEAGSWAVPVATIVGRPLGVVAATELAIAAGLKRIKGVGWRELLVIGCTTSVGLAVALFFATAAMPFGPLLLETKMGALLTVAGAGLAIGLASVLRVGRFGK